MKHLHAHFLTRGAALSALATALLLAAPAPAQTYTAASKSTSGLVGDDDSGEPRISADGRYVAFASKASNLVAGDSNGYFDIYLRDMLLGTTTRVSMGLAGAEPNEDSRWPEISEDGAFVLYSSKASNLVSGDGNFGADLFLYTVATGATERVNLTWLGIESSGDVQMDNRRYDLSDDGRYIVFTSTADDYVSEFTGGATRDVYLRDRTAGTTSIVSYLLGSGGSSGGYAPSISGDGSLVAFTSNDRLLHPDDPDSNDDVFLSTTATGAITLISYGTTGMSGSSPGHSKNPRLSPDGSYVVFESTCSDIVTADSDPYSDVFLRDLTTGVTELISIARALTTATFGIAQDADLSADARYVVFSGSGMSNAPTPILGTNVYLRDRTAGTTELLDNPRPWFSGFMRSASSPQITDSADAVVMIDAGGTAEEGSSIYGQVNRRSRIVGSGTMSLTGFNDQVVGYTMTLSAYDGPASATCYILRAPATTGTLFAGHSFDLGGAINVLGVGSTDADGNFIWTSPLIPPSASGLSLHLELAATDGLSWFDSNTVALSIL